MVKMMLTAKNTNATTWFFDGILPLEPGTPVKIENSRTLPLPDYVEVGNLTVLSSDSVYHGRTFWEQPYLWPKTTRHGIISQLIIEDTCTIFLLNEMHTAGKE